MGIRASRVDGSPTMEQLSKRPQWQADSDTPTCSGCECPIGPLNRHHCRCCGVLFCASCTRDKTLLPLMGYGTAQRVCRPCLERTHSEDWSSAMRVSPRRALESPKPTKGGLYRGDEGADTEVMMSNALSLFGPGGHSSTEVPGAPSMDEILRVPYDDAVRKWPVFGAKVSDVDPEERLRVKVHWGPHAPRWLKEKVGAARKLGYFSPPRSPSPAPSSQGVTDSLLSEYTPAPAPQQTTRLLSY